MTEKKIPQAKLGHKTFTSFGKEIVRKIGPEKLSNLMNLTERTVYRRFSDENITPLAAHEFFSILEAIKGENLLAYDFIPENDIEGVCKSGTAFIEIKKFNDHNGVDQYLSSLEKNGRIVALSKFPSNIYLSTPCKPESSERLKAYKNYKNWNVEYYPISSLIDFAFSPSSLFSGQEKISILEKVDQYFSLSRTNQLYFYTDEELGIVSRTELEIILSRKQIVFEIPTKYTLIVMEHPLLVDELNEYFLDTLKSTINNLDSKIVLSNLKLCLKENGEETESLLRFYNLCNMENKKIGEAIFHSLSPFIKEKIKP